MFFYLSKTISYLFLPGSLIGICWLLYFVFRKKSFSKYLAIAGFSLFVLFTNDFVANSLLKAWEAPPISYENLPAQNYTYGVLLTGMTNTQKQPDSKTYFNQNADRILQSLQLFQNQVIDTLYISGGGATALRTDLQEAKKLYDFMATLQVDMTRIKIEYESRNTVESARLAVEKLSKEESILLITSASHMPRAAGCFRKVGLNVVAYPTVFYSTDNALAPDQFIPSSNAYFKWTTLFKEWMGYSAYKLAGYL